MNIVIPMAGRGQRFQDAGYSCPKMLIEIAGKPMLYWALDSIYPWLHDHEPLFICLKDHLEQFPIEAIIKQYCGHAKIIGLDQVTNGQAETVYKSAERLRLEEPLLIYNCDTYMISNLYDVLCEPAYWKADGVISVFHSNDECFSYASLKSDGYVEKVMEKQVISSMATTGLYFFAKASFFVNTVESVIRKADTFQGEYYIAPIYNELIEQGHQFVLHQADICYPLGTPEQVGVFENMKSQGKN